MDSSIQLNTDAVNDLPEKLRSALLSYVNSKDEKDLDILIKEALADFATEELPGTLTDSTNFIEELGLDSLSITEFIFFFEDVFNLQISNEDLIEIRTIGSMKRFLLSHLA